MIENTLTAKSTLGQFFVNYYVPQRLYDARDRTKETYRNVLDAWVQLTGDPPLEVITSEMLRQFLEDLQRRPVRPVRSANTVRKYCRHLQAVLDRAGPAGPRCRDAAGLLERVPWVRPPRAVKRRPQPCSTEDVVAVYDAADAARFPQLDEISPRVWWRALVVVMGSTGLRIGQVLALPIDSVDWVGCAITTPAEINCKSRCDEYHPLHPHVLRDLLPLRGQRALLLPWPHARTQLYVELDRLSRAAGLPESRPLRFHAIRRNVLTALAQRSAAAAQMAAGHESFRTTVDSYLGEQVLREAVDELPLFDRLRE